MEKKFYVYVHRRKSDGSIFYVGKGCGRRAWTKSNRSIYWWNIKKKHGFEVDIIIQELSEVCALSMEVATISRVSALGNKICNLTKGGEGVSGLKHSEYSRNKMSGPRPNCNQWLRGKSMPSELKSKLRDAKLGRKQSPEHAQKSRTNKIGVKVKDTSMMNIEKRKPVTNSNGEVFESAAHAAKHLSHRLGVNASQGNITMCIHGKRKTAYGMSWSFAPCACLI